MMTEQETRADNIMAVARNMMIAARTAPKGCGVDNLEIAVLCRDELPAFADAMRHTGERLGKAFFMRDAGNVEGSDAVVLIGTRHSVRKLNCGYCGFATCREKSEQAPATPCAFSVTDLGIAVGSAAAVAADARVDNRILYSAGAAAMELGYMPDCTIVFAIALSASGKNIYFDRQNKCETTR